MSKLSDEDLPRALWGQLKRIRPRKWQSSYLWTLSIEERGDTWHCDQSESVEDKSFSHVGTIDKGCSARRVTDWDVDVKRDKKSTRDRSSTWHLVSFTRERGADTMHFALPLTVIGPFLDRYIALSVTTQLHYGNEVQHIAQINDIPKRRKLWAQMSRCLIFTWQDLVLSL